MIYSHSRIETFKQCPLKFKYRYLDKIIPEVETIESFLGSRVHEALEWLYKQVKMEKLPDLKELLDIFKKNWEKNFNVNIKFIKEFEDKDYFNTGTKFLTNYYERYKPFKENTIATEKQIFINLDKYEKYQMQGFIDRLVYDETKKTYEIHDYKTSGYLKTNDELEEDKQLALYSLAIREMYQDADKICLIWHFLAFDKEFCLEVDEKILKKVKEETLNTIKKIENTDKFDAKASKLCDWCEYKPICPKWKHLEEIKDKPINEFLKEEGVNLVNKYSELLLQKQKVNMELDENLEKLKEALVKYSEKNNLDTIFGSNKKARVWIKDVLKFPNKNEIGRDVIKTLLINHGFYNDLSDVDTFKLSRMIEENKLPKDLIEKLKELHKIERLERIYLVDNNMEKEN